MAPEAELRDALFNAEDNRANFKQIIAKRSDLVQYAGGRMTAPGSLTRYEAGLVLGIVTATGRYAPYDNAHSDGTEVAVGVLSETTDADDDDNGTEIVVIKSGILFADKLIGLDSAAKTDLAANSYAEHGVNLISIRA